MRFLPVAILLISFGCYAQETGPLPQAAAPSQPQAAVPAEKAMATIPPGTRITLSQLRPIYLNTIHPGEAVYLLSTFPVSVDGKLLIPPGTYVQATVDKIKRHGVFWHTIELQLHLDSVTFPSGYAVSIPSPAAVAASAAAAANSGGAVQVGPIGGRSVGAAITVALVTRAENYFMVTASPVEMVLQGPLEVDVNRATAPAVLYSPFLGINLPEPELGPRAMHTCFTPGTPGTPDIYVSGTPGTPAIGDFPGTPGTPGYTIPGTPPTAGTAYPCP